MQPGYYLSKPLYFGIAVRHSIRWLAPSCLCPNSNLIVPVRFSAVPTVDAIRISQLLDIFYKATLRSN